MATPVPTTMASKTIDPNIVFNMSQLGAWWLVVGGWWLVVGAWWLVVGGWWLVARDHYLVRFQIPQLHGGGKDLNRDGHAITSIDLVQS